VERGSCASDRRVVLVCDVYVDRRKEKMGDGSCGISYRMVTFKQDGGGVLADNGVMGSCVGLDQFDKLK